MNNAQAALIASAAMHAGDKYETNSNRVLDTALIFKKTLDKWDRDDADLKAQKNVAAATDLVMRMDRE